MRAAIPHNEAILSDCEDCCILAIAALRGNICDWRTAILSLLLL
jgi:hypothetical protein